MQKFNELFSRACDLSERGKKCTVDLNELSAIRDEFWALRKCAEAAEANLAELDKQEPYGWLVGLPGLYPVFTLDYRNVEQAIAAGGYEITPIYTLPAPDINLADLVPESPTREMFRSVEWRSEHKDGLECYHTENLDRIWGRMRRVLLRKIKEAE